MYDLQEERPVYYCQPVVDTSWEQVAAGMSRVPARIAPVGEGKARVARWKRPPAREGSHTALAVAGDRVATGTREGVVWLTDWRTCELRRIEEGAAIPVTGPVSRVLLMADVRALGREEGLLHVVGMEGEAWSLDLETGAVRPWPRKLPLEGPTAPFHLIRPVEGLAALAREALGHHGPSMQGWTLAWAVLALAVMTWAVLGLPAADRLLRLSLLVYLGVLLSLSEQHWVAWEAIQRLLSEAYLVAAATALSGPMLTRLVLVLPTLALWWLVFVHLT